MKINFKNDYSELIHPTLLKRLVEIAQVPQVAYGLDEYSLNAKKLINKECDNDAEVFFLAGGTQTNMVFIQSALKQYESVIACETGHINVHETGAVEATGHKISVVKGSEGKVSAKEVEKCVLKHCDEHMVMPRIVYISQSTEIGTVYTLRELKDLRQVCDKYGLYLFVDGARLGSALTCSANDVNMDDLARLSDAFYIGGTKNGACLGEALVINNKDLSKNFRYIIKNRGAMLAKGYLVGIQFEELFKDGLFYKIGMHENEMADIIRDALVNKGIKFFVENTTNQIFPILNAKQVETLSKYFDFEIWDKISKDKIVIRLVTSFNTSLNDVNQLKDMIKRI